MSIDLAQAAVTILPTVGSMLFYMWKRGEHAKKEQAQRHAENKASIDAVAQNVAKIQIAEEYMPQHFHQEFYTGMADEPLRASGIIKRPENGRKK